MFRLNQVGEREILIQIVNCQHGPRHPPTTPLHLSLPPYLVSAIAFLRESQFRMSLFAFGLIRIGRTAEEEEDLEEAKKAAMLITSPPLLTD